MNTHPGFATVAGRMAARYRQKHGGSMKNAKTHAGAMLAAATRRASAAAKRRNPRLRRVPG